MTYVIPGILGGRRQKASKIRVIPITTYDEVVASFAPNVVSYWKFANTGTDQQGTQNAVITGTPELDVDTIVENDAAGVCIAWPGTTGEYAQASHNAAHKTASGTLVATFQNDRLDIKSTLVAADANGAAGGLSLEVNTNGSPRGFLRNASGTPVVLTGTAGDLLIDRAYTMFLKWGTGGLSLSLWNDNGVLVRRVTNILADGVTGTSPIRFGAWHSDTSHHDGPYGRVIWLNRRITDAEEAILALAKTIDHQDIEIPPPIVDFMVPRTDVWLTNDDMAIPATGTKRYAKPGGSGVGGTTEAAAGDLQTTLTASAAGDTVICLQGYYSVINGLTFPAGSSVNNPVTVMAKPNEWCVLCQDIDLTKISGLDAGAGRTTAVPWTLFDAAHNIWRIPYTVAGGVEVSGCWFEGGIAHLLWNYPSVAAMQASQSGDLNGDTRDSVGLPQTRSVYWSAGLATDGSFLYIRFDRPNWTDVGKVDASFGAWPDDDRYTIGVEGQTTPRKWFVRSNAADFKTGRPVLPNPLNETPNSDGDFPSGRNPNNARIYAARRQDRKVINAASGSFIRLGSGMNTHGYRMFADGKSNIEVHRGCDWLWQHGLVTTTANISNITFHRRRMFNAEWRLLASMGAIHFSEFLSPPTQTWESGYVPWFMVCGSGRSMTNVNFDNCLICGYQEVMVDAGTWSQVRFVNCCFHLGYDEFMQIHPQRVSQFEVGYCYFRDHVFGMSTNQDTTGTASPYGKVFFHHNIIDTRFPTVSFEGRWVSGGPVAIGRNNTTDTSQKMYNNTWIQSPDDKSGRGCSMGNQLNHERTGAGATSRLLYDEVFNNILVRHDNKRYRTNEGGSTARSDDVEQALITTGTHNAYRDYNCYSRHGLPIAPGFSGYERGKYYLFNFHVGGPFNSYSYIRSVPTGEPSGSVFFGSSDYNNTKTMQTLAHPLGRGFDDNSTDANPGIPSQTAFPLSRLNYRPTNLSAVSAPSTPPSQTDWWTTPGWTSYGALAIPFSLAPSAWKGALDPNGSTTPVGILNP